MKIKKIKYQSNLDIILVEKEGDKCLEIREAEYMLCKYFYLIQNAKVIKYIRS